MEKKAGWGSSSSNTLMTLVWHCSQDWAPREQPVGWQAGWQRLRRHQQALLAACSQHQGMQPQQYQPAHSPGKQR